MSSSRRANKQKKQRGARPGVAGLRSTYSRRRRWGHTRSCEAASFRAWFDRLTLDEDTRSCNIVGAHPLQRSHPPTTACFIATEAIPAVSSGTAGSAAGSTAGRAADVAGLDARDSALADGAWCVQICPKGACGCHCRGFPFRSR